MNPSDVLKKIGCVSKDLDLPIHVIRFWEKKIKILEPIKKPNGTRYYSYDQIQILEEIKVLLYKKKYSIEGVNIFFREKKRLDFNDEKQKLTKEIRNLINDIKVEL